MLKADTPAIVLAPMDGVTDFLMRSLLTRRMPFSYCVTEFVRISALVPPRHIFLKDVPELSRGCVTENCTPVQVQLLGGNPERLALSAALAVSLGAKSIDLNFGCPAPTVNRHDGGATLLKFPDRIEEIVSAVRSALPAHVPVSAKLRLGWDDPRAIHENAQRAVKGGASWITIHGRTKEQGYTPPAYWRPIGEVRRQVGVPVIANGEIWTLDDLKRCQDETSCSHFMIGRGALADPFLIGRCTHYLGISPAVRDDDSLPTEELCWKTWRSLIEDVTTTSRSHAESERRTLSRVKQWLQYAHRQKTISWFDGIKRCRDTLELSRALAALDDQGESRSAKEQRIAA
jgi:tRNA-dihydrouridine synthase C